MKSSVCLLVFLSTSCLGHPLFREKKDLFTRDADEYTNTTTTLSCSAKLFACPKTPVNVLLYGNPLKGEDFMREGFFTESCRYLEELNQCVEDNNVMIMSDPDCAVARIMASIVDNQRTTVCKTPLLSMLGELRTCFNSNYKEMVGFLTRYEELSKKGTEKDAFCSLYGQLVDDTVALLKTCPNTQFLWTAKNENLFRENLYPGVFPKHNSFQCDKK